MMPSVLVVAAVIERDGRLLVCQRAANKRYGGLWEFPGGKVDGGESMSDAAVRELWEELSLTVRSVGEVRYRRADPGSNFIIEFVDVVADGNPVPHEHQAVRWVARDELMQVQLAPSDRAFVESLSTVRR